MKSVCDTCSYPETATSSVDRVAGSGSSDQGMVMHGMLTSTTSETAHVDDGTHGSGYSAVTWHHLQLTSGFRTCCNFYMQFFVFNQAHVLFSVNRSFSFFLSDLTLARFLIKRKRAKPGRAKINTEKYTYRFMRSIKIKSIADIHTRII